MQPWDAAYSKEFFLSGHTQFAYIYISRCLYSCADSNCEEQSMFTVTLILRCLTLVVIGSLQCVAGQSASGDANMEDRQAKVTKYQLIIFSIVAIVSNILALNRDS